MSLGSMGGQGPQGGSPDQQGMSQSPMAVSPWGNSGSSYGLPMQQGMAASPWGNGGNAYGLSMRQGMTPSPWGNGVDPNQVRSLISSLLGRGYPGTQLGAPMQQSLGQPPAQVYPQISNPGMSQIPPPAPNPGLYQPPAPNPGFSPPAPFQNPYPPPPTGQAPQPISDPRYLSYLEQVKGRP